MHVPRGEDGGDAEEAAGGGRGGVQHPARRGRVSQRTRPEEPGTA
jgi:hypothetical protein